MSACHKLTYSNVSADAWNCIKQAVSQYIQNPPNAGTKTVDGFTIVWSYNPGNLQLQVQCTDSPWWAPCSTINSKINDVIDPCLKQYHVEQVNIVDA